MNSESTLIIELWHLVRDNIPNNKKGDLAISFIKTFIDYGFDEKDIHYIVEDDDYLVKAFETFFHEEHDDDDEENYDAD